MNRRRRPYGFTLIELLAVIAIGTMLLGILGRLLVDALMLQRRAAEHADRVAVIESLTRCLRQDALGAVAGEWSANTLRLSVPGGGGASEIAYWIRPSSVQRVGPAGAERVWTAARLQFAARLETGPRGAVLWLNCTEEPPTHRSPVAVRTYAVPFLLPPTEAGGGSTSEGEP